MGITYKQTAGNAPDVNDGLAAAIYRGVSAESHPDWAGPGKFGYDDGERWRFNFVLVDPADEAVIVQEGEELEVDTITRQVIGPKSNAFAIINGLLAPAEKALIEAGEEFNDDVLVGRPCTVNIEHNTKGWPVVQATFPRTPAGTTSVTAKSKAKASAKVAAPDPAAERAAAIAAAKALLAEAGEE